MKEPWTWFDLISFFTNSLTSSKFNYTRQIILRTYLALHLDTRPEATIWRHYPTCTVSISVYEQKESHEMMGFQDFDFTI
jgi:hypothetical protein